MEIIIEEVAIDVVRMVIIATTMKEENKIQIEMRHKKYLFMIYTSIFRAHLSCW